MNESKNSQILKVERELSEAMKTGDVSKLDELIHDDLLFNIPNGQTVTKAYDLESYRSGNVQFTDITLDDYQINFIEDNAVVAVTAELKGSFSEQKIDGKFRFLRVWKRVNNQWQIIAGSSMML